MKRATTTLTRAASENAVKSQTWIAVCAYVLMAIVRKRRKLAASMHEILQSLSVTLFEDIRLNQIPTVSVGRAKQSDEAAHLSFCCSNSGGT